MSSAEPDTKNKETASSQEQDSSCSPKSNRHDDANPSQDTSKAESNAGEELSVDAEPSFTRASFDDMNLKDNLLRGIYAYGFETPSPIQKKAILPVTTGRDVIAQAQSGTGKTGTFSIGALQQIDDGNTHCQVVIVSPTRELAQQTGTCVKCLSSYMKTNVNICVGGTRLDPQGLKTAQVVVGTPGRIKDVIGRGMLRVDDVRVFVLDEADEMLSHGFRDDIYDIFQELPEKMQVCLFSATMPTECLQLSTRFMRDPIKILVKQEMVTLEGILQYYIGTGEERHKLETLLDIYDSLSIAQTIIFCNSRRKVQWLSDQLEQRDFTVSSLTGDMEFPERQRVMGAFRQGASRILITTNLVARGINVQTVSLVINFDLPRDRESYVHRIGRSGRHGRKGVAISFVNDDQAYDLRDLEKFYDTEIKELPSDIAALM
jgi:translation initiation factor 4A